MKVFASILQIAGLLTITAATAFLSFIAAGIVLGVSAIVVGVALELR